MVLLLSVNNLEIKPLNISSVDGSVFPLTQLRIQKIPYYRAIWQKQLDPWVLLVTDGAGRPLAAALADDSNGSVGYYDTFSEIEVSADLEDWDLSQAAVETVEHALADWAKAANIPLELVVKFGATAGLSPTERTLMSAGATMGVSFRGYLNLQRSESEIFASLRKSTRKRIRSSMNLLEGQTEILTATGPVSERMNEMRLMHLATAGRATRSRESWDVMETEILEGTAEAVFCRKEGHLVATTFVRFGAEVTEVGTSVNARDHFHIPLGHFPKWMAILSAKKRGQKWMIFDNLFPSRGEGGGEKLAAIGEFKRGFAPEIALLKTFSLGSA